MADYWTEPQESLTEGTKNITRAVKTEEIRALILQIWSRQRKNSRFRSFIGSFTGSK